MTDAPRRITLEAWKQAEYGDKPNMDTVRRWARNGLIYPAPEKVGRTYYVAPNARYLKPGEPIPADIYVPDRAPRGVQQRLIDRINNYGSASTKRP